jgi:hypothetical protein
MYSPRGVCKLGRMVLVVCLPSQFRKRERGAKGERRLKRPGVFLFLTYLGLHNQYLALIHRHHVCVCHLVNSERPLDNHDQ